MSAAIAIVQLGPLLVGGDRTERQVGHPDREIERAAVADVDDGRQRPRRAGEQPAHLLDRPLRRRQPDALERAARRSASRRSSDSARCAPRLSCATAWISSTITVSAPARKRRLLLGGEQDVERLGRRDEDVRRPARHRLALVRRRVAGAHHDAQRRAAPSPCEPASARARQRLLQVLLHVVAERLQRRDVDDVRAVLERAGRAGGEQAVERPQERRQRLARSRRRGDQRVGAGGDRRPSRLLRRRRRAEALGEPARGPAARTARRRLRSPSAVAPSIAAGRGRRQRRAFLSGEGPAIPGPCPARPVARGRQPARGETPTSRPRARDGGRPRSKAQPAVASADPPGHARARQVDRLG